MNRMVTISRINNPNVLNIFSDASTTTIKGEVFGCYGAIAVNQINPVETVCLLDAHTTANNCEIKGLRTAISLATKYAPMYRYINIYSDSLISVEGLRNYIYNWRYDSKSGLLYTGRNTPAANQNVFVECFMMLDNAKKINPNIRLFHQPAHIDPNNRNALNEANYKFRFQNGIKSEIDENYIRYICLYNNLVDHTTRNTLLSSINTTIEYSDGIEFQPSIIDKYRKGEL